MALMCEFALLEGPDCYHEAPLSLAEAFPSTEYTLSVKGILRSKESFGQIFLGLQWIPSVKGTSSVEGTSLDQRQLPSAEWTPSVEGTFLDQRQLPSAEWTGSVEWTPSVKGTSLNQRQLPSAEWTGSVEGTLRVKSPLVQGTPHRKLLQPPSDQRMD